MYLLNGFERNIEQLIQPRRSRNLANVLSGFNLYWRQLNHHHRHDPDTWNKGDWLHGLGHSSDLYKQADEQATVEQREQVRSGAGLIYRVEKALQSWDGYQDLCCELRQDNYALAPRVFAAVYCAALTRLCKLDIDIACERQTKGFNTHTQWSRADDLAYELMHDDELDAILKLKTYSEDLRFHPIRPRPKPQPTESEELKPKPVTGAFEL